MLYVDEVIGRGSFGTVYRGRMRTPDGLVRRVAIKVLSDAASQDQRAVARFRDEARLLALIDHPGLVPVYALEQIDNRWAVVMGFVDGFELAGALRFGPLPAEVVREVGIQVAEILDALWTHPHPDTGEPLRVVHRDVKPHNLMMDAQGNVRLLDLGVARARFDARESATVAGEVAGTLAYMSPQRWARRDDAHGGDMYALGATLFQLATAQLAQEAGPHPEAHAERLETGAALIPPDLFQWIARAMAFDDKARPEAAELAAGLRAIGPQEGPSARQWAQQLIAEHELRGSGVPDGQRDSSFIGGHELSTETTFLSTHFDGTDLATELPTTAEIPPPRRGWGPPLAALGVAAVMATGAFAAWQLGGPVEVAPAGPPLRVAMAPTDPNVVLRDHQPLRMYLEGELHRPVEFFLGDSYTATADLLVHGDVDYAQLPYGAGSAAMEQDPRIRRLASKVVDGSTSVDGYLIVSRDDRATTLEDLRGATLCYSDVGSSTGYRLPREYLESQGFDPDTDFVAHVSGDHGQVLRDVIDGTCRLGSTFNRNLMTAEQRGIPGSRLKIFALTGSIPHEGWYAGAHADPGLTEAVTRALIAFDPKQVTGADTIGSSERISGFQAP